MKQLRTLLFIFALFPVLTFAQTAWKEGTHYEVINDQVSAKPQVKEVFSYWCPACNNFEVIVKQLKETLPKDTKFVKAHVNFLGGASRETQEIATTAMLAARAMKDEERFNAALFSAIHKQRQRPKTMEDFASIYAIAGGDALKLTKLASSFGIKGQFNRNNQAIKGFRNVPTFVVNDKYKAIFTRDMTPDSFVSLINWLLKQK